MAKYLTILAILLFSSPMLFAQNQTFGTIYGTGTPTGNCAPGIWFVQLDKPGTSYSCAPTGTPGVGTWVLASGSTSSTSVTDIPRKVFVAAGLCNNATASTTWSLPTSSAPSPACVTGTNTQLASLNFAHSQSAQATIELPSDWDASASVDSKIFFSSSSTSGTVIFDVALSCTNSNGTQTDDQAFNTLTSYATVTLASPANALWGAAATGLNTTNCSAGELLHIKVTRDASDTASDTGVAVRGVSLTIRSTF